MKLDTLSPFLYCPGVQRIMAVGIEPEAMTEARLSCKVFFGYALKIVDESAMCFSQLAQDIGECKVSSLCYHLRIETVDAAIAGVSRWLLPVDDDR